MPEVPSKTPRMNEMVWKSDRLRDLYANLSPAELEAINSMLENIISDSGYIAFFDTIKSFNSPRPVNPDYFTLNLQGDERDLGLDPERRELRDIASDIRFVDRAIEYLDGSLQEKEVVASMAQKGEPYSFVWRRENSGKIVLFMNATASAKILSEGEPLYLDNTREIPRPFQCHMVLQTSNRVGVDLVRLFLEDERMVFHAMRGLCQLHGDSDRANMEFETYGHHEGKGATILNISRGLNSRKAKREAWKRQQEQRDRERQQAAIEASRKTLGQWFRGLFSKKG